MCTGIELIAAAGTAASVGGSIMSFGAQSKAAWEQRAYNAKVEALNEKHRAGLIQYQNVVYQQEVDYGGRMLEYQRSEFKRQGDFQEKAVQSVQKNLFAQYATLLQRAVEENMANSFDVMSSDKATIAARAKGQVAADARGIEGSSVEQLINDASRQGGDNDTILALNRSATARQLHLEAMGLKASADQQIYNLPIQTFQPIAPINPPSPVSPVQPAAPVAGPNRGAMIANVVGGVIAGADNYVKWSGNSFKNAFSFK